MHSWSKRLLQTRSTVSLLSSVPRRTSLEVRASSKLSLLSAATRAFSSSALDTYWLTCGKPSYIDSI